MSSVAVLIPTYRRRDILKNTVAKLQTHIPYDLNIYIGCGHPEDNSIDVSSMGSNVRLLKTERVRPLGDNINALIKHTTEPVIMQMDDDHWLNSDIVHFKGYVDSLLNDKNKIGWIRLYGIGAHDLVAKLHQRLWVISWEKSQSELYITSMRPHLKLRDWHRRFGLYPTGRKLGETEEAFCHQCKNIAANMPNNMILYVATPTDFDTEGSWSHVGESWQLNGK